MIADDLEGSPFFGEGHRKVWARLRVAGVWPASCASTDCSPRAACVRVRASATTAGSPATRPTLCGAATVREYSPPRRACAFLFVAGGRGLSLVHGPRHVSTSRATSATRCASGAARGRSSSPLPPGVPWALAAQSVEQSDQSHEIREDHAVSPGSTDELLHPRGRTRFGASGERVPTRPPPERGPPPRRCTLGGIARSPAGNRRSSRRTRRRGHRGYPGAHARSGFSRPSAPTFDRASDHCRCGPPAFPAHILAGPAAARTEIAAAPGRPGCAGQVYSPLAVLYSESGTRGGLLGDAAHRT